jgi:hypothetical protein
MEKYGSDPSQSALGISGSRDLRMETESCLFGIKDGRKFEVECNAGDAGALRVGTESLFVKVGQRVRRNGCEEIWHCVQVYAQEEQGGNLAVRVVVSHPDWDEPLQVANIKSRPNDETCEATLGCDLDHVRARVTTAW